VHHICSVAKHFSTFVDQVKLLVALSYGRFKAIRHNIDCKGTFKKSLVNKQKLIAPEICESETLWATD
jgi:hypothetical protein